MRCNRSAFARVMLIVLAAGPLVLKAQREMKPASDDIRRRAYEIYLQRINRGEPGSPESDWCRAERELAQR